MQNGDILLPLPSTCHYSVSPKCTDPGRWKGRHSIGTVAFNVSTAGVERRGERTAKMHSATLETGPACFCRAVSFSTHFRAIFNFHAFSIEISASGAGRQNSARNIFPPIFRAATPFPPNHVFMSHDRNIVPVHPHRCCLSAYTIKYPLS